MIELTEFLVKSLVKNKDAVSVKQYDEDDMINLEVMVDEDDLGRVIGRRGIIANSIRTVVQASSYINNDKRVKINIDSF